MSALRPAQIVCLIPCAGAGTRLRPLTLSRCKQLLPVCNRPVIDHVLGAVSEAGLREIVVIVNPEEPDLREYVGEGARWGLRVQWAVQDEPRGIADAVLKAEDQVAGRPFIVYLADNLFGGGIVEFVTRFAGVYPAGLLRLKEVDDPRQYGVAVVRDGVVESLVEKPPQPPSRLAITGLYGLGPSFFEAARRAGPSARGELEITDALVELIRGEAGIRAEPWDGEWEDTGHPAALLHANETLLAEVTPGAEGAVIRAGSVVAGRVRIGEGTVVEESRLQGPAIIGRGCRIVRSEIGPNVSVGDGAVIEDSRVRDSILDIESVVRDRSGGLVASIVGHRAQVVGAGDEPVSVIVGDGASLEVGY
jgi:glucose-1-phosphate thymidylyltransferase